MSARLAVLGARRMLVTWTTAGALALAAWAALDGGSVGEVALGPDAAARAGARTEAAWTAFLALVAPCLAWRAASLRTRGETAWIATSGTGLARGEASLAVGALAAVLALVAAWSAFVATRASTSGEIPALAGRCVGPTQPLVDHASPRTWRADVPDGAGLTARVDVSLLIAPGGGGEARLSARRASGGDAEVASALVLPRGGVDVRVPDGTGPVEFALTLPEPGARGYVASDDVTLWRAVPASSGRTRTAARVALALAAWTLLAFGLGAWTNALVATGLVAAAACALAWSDVASRPFAAWIPGATLARDLALVAEDRAPAAIGFGDCAGAVFCALVAAALSRRGPEGRP